jgi:WXG100 family type VII secretion target
MVEIRVSPERLRSVASQLDNQRTEIDSTLTRMKGMIDNLSGEWSGLAQLDYAQMFDSEVPRMQTQINEILENLTQALRKVATDFERTDQDTI